MAAVVIGDWYSRVLDHRQNGRPQVFVFDWDVIDL
jgi:hypothetical protein